MRTPNVPAAVEPTVSTDHTERRYVYNENFRKQPAASVPRPNRHVRPRKRSLFSIITILLSISLLIVFYVWNKIRVNDLNEEIRKINNDIKISDQNIEYINSKITQKTGIERIEKIAIEQLNFVYSKKPVIPLIISEDEFKRLQEE
jgi:cell division protein FtsL